MRYLVLPLFTTLLAGCDSGLAMATIRGEVKINGQPVDKGVISFIPAGGNGRVDTVSIVAGKYEVKTLAGKHAVQISAPIVTGRRPEYNGPGAPMVDIISERLPAEYNSNTALTFEAQPGDNIKDWLIDLK